MTIEPGIEGLFPVPDTPILRFHGKRVQDSTCLLEHRETRMAMQLRGLRTFCLVARYLSF